MNALLAPIPLHSIISIHNIYTVNLNTFQSGFTYTGEQHPFWEFSYIHQGSIGLTAENEVYHCHAGQAVIHAPNMFHSMWVENMSSCTSITIAFDGHGFLNHLKPGNYVLSDEEKCIINLITQDLIQLTDDKSQTRFECFFNDMSPNSPIVQIFKNRLELLFLSLMQNHDTINVSPRQDIKAQRYAKIITYLKENAHRNLTITTISKEIFESPSTIKEVFRHFTGNSIMKFYNHLRCEHIMQLLAKGYNAKIISEMMEFSSPYYLSHFFKRETGMTIREYIKSNRP